MHVIYIYEQIIIELIYIHEQIILELIYIHKGIIIEQTTVYYNQISNNKVHLYPLKREQ